MKAKNLNMPRIAVGCMRISNMNEDEAKRHVTGCIERGLNFFDHADIYGGGQCEEIFGKAAKGIDRESMIIQSKCGIVPGKMFDFSKAHIINSVDGILKRLQTEYLDILLLHRPDALVEPEEVAEAFDELQSKGKVRNFGVSNHSPAQIELLKKYVSQDIAFNQLQMSLPFSGMISAGLEVNMATDGGMNRDGYLLDYCRLNDITIQTWSPFQYGFFEGSFIGNNDKFKELNKVMEELAGQYGVTPTGIATAWILRHPAKMQMIAGTTKLERLQEMIDGSNITLTREEWYRLYLAAGHILP